MRLLRKYLFVFFICFLPILVLFVSCSSGQPPAATVSYNRVLSASYTLINDVSSQLSLYKSDKSAMNYFRERLSEFNISAGLVTIKDKQSAEGNLDYCIAINTLDRGIVFLTVMPKSLTMDDPEQRLQFVYLMEGERIGLLPAKFASSSDYTWYTSYLKEVYAYFDRCKYLAELSDLLDKFEQGVNSIRATMLFASQGEINQLNSLIDEYNQQIVRYNELALNALGEQDQYPENLFYIEIETNTWGPAVAPFPSISIPILFPTIEQLSSQMQKIVSLNENAFKVERVTDKNFIVSDFEIKW